jgi:hypothetical protein
MASPNPYLDFFVLCVKEHYNYPLVHLENIYPAMWGFSCIKSEMGDSVGLLCLFDGYADHFDATPKAPLPRVLPILPEPHTGV